MSVLANLIVKIGADSTDLDKHLGKIESRFNKLGGQLQSIGSKLTKGLTLPLAALGGGALKASIDFESAFAGVRKTVDATEEEFAVLRQGIRDMAKEIPQSATDIARIAEAAGQLGIRTDAILGFTRVMADLGVTTNMSSDQAAEALARLANITQMPQNEFDRLGSTVVALGNNLATTEAEIVEMALRIAGAGHTVGMTEDQILSFAGALSSVGIEAQAGGSAISRVMVEMANQVASGGEKLRLFAQVAGMTSSDFKRAFEQDAALAILAFIEGLGRMQASGQNVFPILEELGLSEVRVRDAMLRAAGAGDLFRRSLELGSQAWEENTALTREAEERYRTTESQLKILRNRVNDVAITLGDSLVPVLIKAIDASQPLLSKVESLAKWFANLDVGTQETIVQILAFTAALGPALYVIGTVTKALSGLVGVVKILVGAKGLGVLISLGSRIVFAFQAWTAGAATFAEALLYVSGNPVGLVLAGIGLIAAAAYKLQREWGPLWEGLATKTEESTRRMYLAGAAFGYNAKEILEEVGQVAGYVTDGVIGRLRMLEYAMDHLTVTWQEDYSEMRRWSEHAERVKKDIGFPGGGGGLAGALEILNWQLEKLDNAWRLYELTTTASADSTEFLTQKKQALIEKIALVGQELGKVEQQYAAVAASKGVNSEAAMNLALKIDELRIKQAEWRKELEITNSTIEEATDLLGQFKKQYDRAGKAFSSYLETVVATGGKIKINQETGKIEFDYGPSTEQYYRGELGIPVMGKGGLVTEPTLAMLAESGPEAVVPLDKYEPRPVEVHLHVGTLVADRQGLKQLERQLREIRIAENLRLGVATS